MHGVIFGLFSASILLLFGMIHTLSTTLKRSTDDHSIKTKWKLYSVKLGLFGVVSFVLAIALLTRL